MPLETTDGRVFHLHSLNTTDFLNKAQIVPTKEEEEDNLQKADLSYAFSGYGADGNNVTFSKTGTQMKEALVKKKATYQAKITTKSALAKMKETTLTEMGCEPPKEPAARYTEEECSSETQAALDSLKVYGWKAMDMFYEEKRKYKGNSNSKEFVLSEDDKAKLKELETKETLMQQHDSCIREIVGCYSDIETCNVMERNLDNKKKYDLTTKQLKALGL